MASTNKTPNYDLSQFIGTDKPAWLTDYNGDMLKIDTAVHEASTTAGSAGSSAESALTAAQAAQTAAEQAATDAAAASKNASDALSIGNTANATATQALADAAAAQGTADSAKSDAGTALTSATAAATAASQALETATGASNTANSLIPTQLTSTYTLRNGVNMGLNSRNIFKIGPAILLDFAVSLTTTETIIANENFMTITLTDATIRKGTTFIVPAYRTSSANVTITAATIQANTDGTLVISSFSPIPANSQYSLYFSSLKADVF